MEPTYKEMNLVFHILGCIIEESWFILLLRLRLIRIGHTRPPTWDLSRGKASVNVRSSKSLVFFFSQCFFIRKTFSWISFPQNDESPHCERKGNGSKRIKVNYAWSSPWHQELVEEGIKVTYGYIIKPWKINLFRLDIQGSISSTSTHKETPHVWFCPSHVRSLKWYNT